MLVPPFLGDPCVQDVAVRGAMALVLARGRVWTAGTGSLGTSLEDSWPVLQPVPALDDACVADVHVGDGFCMVRTRFGEVMGWGR